MTNGQDIVVRGYLKPISTLRRPLESVDLATREPTVAAYERSDVCVVPAAGVIGEAMVAIVLAQAFLEKFGGDSLEEPVAQIVEAVKVTLDKTPPELAADIMEQGIVLTGGGALLKGLDRRLHAETGMPILIADNPLHCVVVGSGHCLEEFDALKGVLHFDSGQ